MPSKSIRIPPLPPLKQLTTQSKQFHGPTPYSNFIIPEILLTGSHPDHRDELSTLLLNGFSTFICLETSFQAQVNSKAKSIKDYSHQGELLARQLKVPFKQINYHIPDFAEKNAPALLKFTYGTVLKALDRGEKVYLHDFGGAGRSGVVASIILALVHQITGGDAMGYVGKLHSTRQSAPLTDSPETTEQRMYVYHAVDKVAKQMPPPTKWRRLRMPHDDLGDDTTSIATSKFHPTESDIDDHSTLNQSYDFSTTQGDDDGLHDDIDLLNDDAIKEFTDMPPQRSPVARHQKSKIISNLPFEIPQEPPVASRAMRGPIPKSNWILKDHVCVGAFPIDTRFGQQRQRQLVVDPRSAACDPVRRLLEAGITTFVCLQAEIPLLNNNKTESAEFIAYDTRLQYSQRYGFKERPGYVPYFDLVQSIVENEYPEIRRVTFIHFPIEEGNVVKPDLCAQLLHDLVDRIKVHERLYIHAGTGHNRECMIGAALLAVLFKLNPSDAIKLMEELHNVREDTQGVAGVPSSHLQKMSVHQSVSHFEGVQSDRITTSARSQVRNDRVYHTGSDIRNRNKATSIVFG